MTNLKSNLTKLLNESIERKNQKKNGFGQMNLSEFLLKIIQIVDYLVNQIKD